MVNSLAAQESGKLPEKKGKTSVAVQKKTKAVSSKKSEMNRAKTHENKGVARTSLSENKENLIKTKQDEKLSKTPKAIFLIKRTKIDADIGEPVLYPFDRQLSNLYYDLPGGIIRND